MEKFRTIFEIPESPTKIDYQSNIISLGSCFSENIGEKLTYYKFAATINPFGILYNPESIANSIEFLIKNRLFSESDLFEHHGVWNSFYHHSRFSGTDKKNVLDKINSSIKQGHAQLKKADFLLITFGTAWVYDYKSTGKTVSNCHKIPAKEFNRRKLTVNSIVKKYKTILKTLQKLNPKLNIVFTVSPVRHLKDGAVQNQLSKATLIMAINELIDEVGNTSYFPSYEIMTDDLRDYRFYNADMVHPSPTAVDYIWDKFKKCCINPNTASTIKSIENIKKAVSHRPFQPQSDSHKKFLKATLSAIEKLETKYPEMDFKTEKAVLKTIP